MAYPTYYDPYKQQVQVDAQQTAQAQVPGKRTKSPEPNTGATDSGGDDESGPSGPVGYIAMVIGNQVVQIPSTLVTYYEKIHGARKL